MKTTVTIRATIEVEVVDGFADNCDLKQVKSQALSRAVDRLGKLNEEWKALKKKGELSVYVHSPELKHVKLEET